MNPYFAPFNYYNRDYFHQPYRDYYRYYPIPFNSYVHSNIASNQQSIYNSGVMTDVIQSSNIMQSGVGCTAPNPGTPPA